MTHLSPDWKNEIPNIDAIRSESQKLPLSEKRESFVVVASRSHLTDETKSFIEKIKGKVKDIEFMSKGSSLKLCMIAQGKADIYPRFAPTSEWDTAAGQAVVEQANGRVIIPDTHAPVIYNKENILNPWFLAVNNDAFKQLEL
jgi:3'(2'), 5'-bisphosphate nucleotidase